MTEFASPFHAAIACGGTGGHLFPGLAIASALQEKGGLISLLLSEKEIDRQVAASIHEHEIVTLPVVNSQRGKWRFFKGLLKSYAESKALFARKRPDFVLGMGGFASAAPVFAARNLGIPAFIHDSNAIPGRANRWLAPWVNAALVGLEAAAPRLSRVPVHVTGTPARPEFQEADAGSSRMALGLDPNRDVLLAMGGSQGATGINQLLFEAAPILASANPALQIIHLTGQADFAKARSIYAALPIRAQVFPFLTEMEVAMNAATLAVSRAGGSSLAELAAVRTPSILIPYPAAADNHQWHNARAFEAAGAAVLRDQKTETGATLAGSILKLLADPAGLHQMKTALATMQHPHAADRIATLLLELAGLRTALSHSTKEARHA